MNDKNIKPKRVAIFGCNVNTVAATRSLKNEENGKYTPVVLICPQSNANGKSIEGVPIENLSNDNIDKIIQKYKVNTLMFYNEQLEMIRKEYANTFLKNDVELVMINLQDPFINDGVSLSSKVQKIQIEDLLGREPIVLNNPNVIKVIENSTILVTGGAGSIGSEIVNQVARYGCSKIIIFDIAESPLNSIWLEIKENYPNVEVIPIIGDVRDLKHVEKIFETYHPSIVYHAAAYKHVPMMELHPIEAVTVNVLGSKNVADTAMKFNANMVMISTDKAVNPSNVMGATKRIAEIYAQSLFYENKEKCKQCKDIYPRIIITRFGNVLGSNGSVVPIFKKQIEKGGPITVTHKEVIRYFMTISEACSLVLEAECMGNGGEVFVFDMGEPVKIYDLAEKMIRLAGKKPNKDIMIVETGLRNGEKLYEELLSDQESTISTYNKKIMIARLPRTYYSEIHAQIEELTLTLQSEDAELVVKTMKKIVPEFKSLNSVFENLDKKMI